MKERSYDTLNELVIKYTTLVCSIQGFVSHITRHVPQTIIALSTDKYIGRDIPNNTQNLVT